MLDMSKPHKGRIANVRKQRFDPTLAFDNLGYFYWVDFVDHPRFAYQSGNVSAVVKEEGNEIETLNSRYTIVSRAN